MKTEIFFMIVVVNALKIVIIIWIVEVVSPFIFQTVVLCKIKGHTKNKIYKSNFD